MPIRPILAHPDPRLRAVCAPVGPVTPGIRALADDLLATMYAAPGRGLAAPQVGVLSRLFVVDVAWKEGAPEPMVMIDPERLDASPETAEAEEACLSIPGRPRTIRRPAAARLAWTDAQGTRHDRWLDGPLARCALHELDHLDGVLIVDR